MSDFKEQFEEQQRQAAKNIREMKVVTPYIFPEWQKLQQATQHLREAHKAVAEAQREWDNLGKYPKKG